MQINWTLLTEWCITMTSWVHENMQPSEDVIFTTGKHWIMLFRPLSFFIFLFFSWWFIIPIVLWTIYRFYKFGAYQLILTNKRIIQKRGFYYIQTEEWPLNKIGDVVSTQLIGDNLLNRGKVILTGHQITSKKFSNLKCAKKLRNAVHSQLPSS